MIRENPVRDGGVKRITNTPRPPIQPKGQVSNKNKWVDVDDRLPDTIGKKRVMII